MEAKLKIDREKAELRQRLMDLASGADGSNWGQTSVAGGEIYVGDAFERWLMSIRDVLLGGSDGELAHLVGCHWVGCFESIDKAVDHLHESGVRADGSHLKADESESK